MTYAHTFAVVDGLAAGEIATAEGRTGTLATLVKNSQYGHVSSTCSVHADFCKNGN